MAFGTSLLLVAAGAVLRWAITTTVSGVNLHAVGVILMAIGVVGFLIALYWMLTAARRLDRAGVAETRPGESYPPQAHA